MYKKNIDHNFWKLKKNENWKLDRAKLKLIIVQLYL